MSMVVQYQSWSLSADSDAASCMSWSYHRLNLSQKGNRRMLSSQGGTREKHMIVNRCPRSSCSLSWTPGTLAMSRRWCTIRYRSWSEMSQSPSRTARRRWHSTSLSYWWGKTRRWAIPVAPCMRHCSWSCRTQRKSLSIWHCPLELRNSIAGASLRTPPIPSYISLLRLEANTRTGSSCLLGLFHSVLSN